MVGEIKLPHYIRIANRLECDIRSGRRGPGEKLEPIREMAKTEGVSINTICTAMDVLRETGLVESRPRVGLIVAGIQERRDFEAFEYFEPDSRLAEQSRQWVNGVTNVNAKGGVFSQMAIPTDNAMFQSFQRSFQKALTQAPNKAGETSAGNPKLRELISEQLTLRQCRVPVNEIQITNGCQNAIEHALRVLCREGDAVAIPTPAFPGYLALLSLLRLKAVEIPMTPSGPDPVLLERVMSSNTIKAVIINPICHNPTGISIDEKYKRDIAVWSMNYKVAVIEDDICAELSFNESYVRPIASYDTEGWVMLVSSVSKLVGDTERIGWCCPGRFKDAYMTQFAISQITGSYFRQHAYARYLGGTRYHSQLRQWRIMSQNTMSQMMSLLEELLGGVCLVTPPSGGYSLWLKLPQELNAMDILDEAKKESIRFLPGQFFSFEDRFQCYLRLVVIPPFSEAHQKGIKVLAKIIHEQIKLKGQS